MAQPASRLLIVAAAIGVLLSGCGFVQHEPREAWRGEAEAACMRSGIVKQTSYVRPSKPIDGPGPCGADLPLKVSAFQNDSQSVALALASTGTPSAGFEQGVLELTTLKPEATLTCPMVAWIDDWMATAVQPAAVAWFGQGVREVRTAGSYACRRRNHMANARLSEHAFGNAIDVMTFVLNDGYIVTVKGGWRGTEQEQGFLRDVFHGACQRFKTVLGPGSDALHYDHFHLDLARHDARGQRRYCRPEVAAPNRPPPGTFGPGSTPWGGPPNATAYTRAPYSQSPAYPGQGTQQQFATGPVYNRPPAASTLPPASTGMLPPRATRAAEPRRSDAETPEIGEGRQDYEIEPDFDPKQFDVSTGSIADLPRPRAGGTALPAASSGLPAPRADLPDPAPQPARRASTVQRRGTLVYNPAGK